MASITVQRANVILSISPEDKDYYMGLGYSVIDDAGKVVERALSDDPNELRTLVTQYMTEKEKLLAEVNELKAQVKKLKSKNNKASEE